jgi:hypothetical protein
LALLWNVPVQLASVTSGVREESPVVAPLADGDRPDSMGVAAGGAEPWNPRRAEDDRAARAAGVAWLRTDVGWEHLEPRRDHWDWDLFDPVVADAQQAGLNLLVVLHTVPAWANGDRGDYAPPDDLSLVTRYCSEVAARYIPRGVVTYEIGNEVNLPHPGVADPTGEAYARTLLVPCVAGVRAAADDLGVEVTVLLGGLAPTDWTGGADPVAFLQAVYADGAGDDFDAVAWHPYTGADRPSASSHVTSDPEALHDVMAAEGDGDERIWATEFGYASDGTGSVTEAEQADLAAEGIAAWRAKPFAGPWFWYSLRDLADSGTDPEDFYGLLRHDGSRKPVYDVIAAHAPPA